MSVDSFVFLRDERLPSVREWQQALDQAGTGIVIDPTDDIDGDKALELARRAEAEFAVAR